MILVIHPTKEEYAKMDALRFPFILEKENLKKDRYKLEERIRRLIKENKESFFDPIAGVEVKPYSL